MKHKRILFLIAWAIITIQSTHTADDWQTSAYFDTRFLAQYEKVKISLIKDGFQETTLESIDGYTLKGLYRKKEGARFNVILCAGFYPGRKEGMASFVELLPEDCNILFIDARGHGESAGPFWSTIPWYGQSEYKDIIGALDFMCNDNHLPNMLLGVCIGAFHCAHAALFIEQQQATRAYNLCGIVFDSGFGSIADLMWVPTTHITEKTLPSLFVQLLYTQDNKKAVKERLLYRAAAGITGLCTQSLTYLVSPALQAYDSKTNLFDKIHTISCPILYIHSKNDDYTPFQDVQSLAQKSQHPTCWWIDCSEHACHHLKHKVSYKEYLLEFINNSLHT